MNHFQQAVEHYAQMALIPGAIDQARFRCKELEKEPMFTGISKAVAERLKELQAGGKCE